MRVSGALSVYIEVCRPAYRGCSSKMKAAIPGIALWLTLLSANAAYCVPVDTRKPTPKEELLSTPGEVGSYGGKLVISERSEPKTLNPVLAADANSKEVAGYLSADLIHINRSSQKTEPALAKSWKVSADGKQYQLQLRRGLRFSDGQPFDADDVLFTFAVYLDERSHSPLRDLLIIGGKPIHLQKVDAYTVRFTLEQPYAAAERLFDSIAILPRHLLKDAFDRGALEQTWTLNTRASEIAGLGPFQLKSYVPGQRLVLERNLYYWKSNSKGGRLPYLDELVIEFSGNADVEAMRFEGREIDVVNRLTAANFAKLEENARRKNYVLRDLGASLEFNFLFFNLNQTDNTSESLRSKQMWFRQLAFRQAVSRAIDRDGIVRLVYLGRAQAIWTPVTSGNKLWRNTSLPQPERSIPEARQVLLRAGFTWGGDGRLLDPTGKPVEFSLIYNAGNPQQAQMTALIQADLSELGIKVDLAPLEFRSVVDRILRARNYDAAIMAISSGDADPNSETNVWTSQGSTHLWDLEPTHALAPWEVEVDRLMHQQMTTLEYVQRKRLYDRVQELIAENLPVICLVSPNVLVGATDRLGNFRPTILANQTLWNAEELFLR